MRKLILEKNLSFTIITYYYLSLSCPLNRVLDYKIVFFTKTDILCIS